MEEVIKEAVGPLTQTILGCLLLLSIGLGGIIIRVLWRSLQEERVAHQETRRAQLEDIRSMAHVATAIGDLSSVVAQMKINQDQLQAVVIAQLGRGRE